ncbi:MAG: hypothetical protein EP298_11470 [Gammaproteobacteria bacterium]|nr:MAG: hypothetical protein EP298_11470 [Gammaproteobacteria bacterium]UTW42117.1 transglycosylase SLT domain-containing protein [bacterium SCSIO 12844]
MLKRIGSVVLITYFVILVAGCATAPPKTVKNACAIVNEYPSWYYDALDSYKKWGVPISVQYAIIRAESDFRSDAQPPRDYALGFIPWGRVTSAYGYAQAVDGTWDWYKKSTGNSSASRSDFRDSVDFIGWYSNYISKVTGIKKTDTYHLYVAYWLGPGNYSNGSYKSNRQVLNKAKKVQSWAWQYASQLKRCDIPKKSSSWFF